MYRTECKILATAKRRVTWVCLYVLVHRVRHSFKKYIHLYVRWRRYVVQIEFRQAIKPLSQSVLIRHENRGRRRLLNYPRVRGRQFVVCNVVLQIPTDYQALRPFTLSIDTSMARLARRSAIRIGLDRRACSHRTTDWCSHWMPPSGLADVGRMDI